MPKNGNELAAKLHPNRFSGMSPKMAAIVAYIVGEEWTNPHITSLSITSDGFLQGCDSTRSVEDNELGDMDLPAIGRSVFLGTAADLESNVKRLLVAAGLTAYEQYDFWLVMNAKITDWRPGKGRV